MAIYLDASALVKLVVEERESPALRRFLAKHPERVTSALSRVEVPRAVRNQGKAAQQRAKRVLSRVRLLHLDDELLDDAARLDPVVLRSLDAIHIASARALGKDLEGVVTYDGRMSDALKALSMSAHAPGGGRAG
jgi:predicted nucleic acid-binding protein